MTAPTWKVRLVIVVIGALWGPLFITAVSSSSSASATSPWPVTTANPTTAFHEIVNVPITMSDGVVLEADEYVPSTCTSTSRCPVILIQTPYRKGQSLTDPADLGSVSSEAQPYLYEHGYIEVVVDVRGTGSSSGYWTSFGPREQQDGAELAQWVADPAHIPESNGHVGLAGVSYGGINQLLTVEAINGDIAGHGPLTDPGSGCVTSPGFNCGNPTHITSDPVGAIFPIVASADVYRDVVFAGGSLDAGFMPFWLGLVNGLALLPPDTTTSNPPLALNALSEHLEDLAKFTAPAVTSALLGSYGAELPLGQDSSEMAYDSLFYTERSPITHIGDVNVPTFLVGGTYDLFQRGEPINYNALDLPSAEKKLLIGPWYHVTEGTNLPTTDTAGNVIPDDNNLEIDWFDRWLPGPNHTRDGSTDGIEKFPTVETYDLGANRWEPNSRYPAAGTTGQRWYLVPGGTLATAKQAVRVAAGELPAITATGACSRSTWQWTAGLPAEIGTSPVCENNSSLSEAQGLSFTTAAMKRPYAQSGPIEADIYMSSTARDSSIIAT
jgi:predicted acyl esterase